MLPEKSVNKNRILNIVLAVIFTIVVAGAGGYIIYYKFYKSVNMENQKKQEETKKEQQKKLQEKQKQEAEQKKKEEEEKQKIEAQKDARYEEGKKLFIDKEYLNAISVADELIKQDPNYYKAYNLKGIALCYYGFGFGGENFTEGTNNIKKALEIKSDDWYSLFNMGLANELYAKYDEAIDWYNKSLQYNDKYEWTYYGIASIYGRRGDVANTVKYLQLAIAINPDGIKKEAQTEHDFDNVRSSQEFQNLIK